MKQEERKQQTIQLLLETTKGLIAQKGCDSITLKDIMDVSGLSKGAIFHHVKSKDEIFAWVLQESLKETNERFINQVEQGPTFDGPMQRISESFSALENPKDVTNKVLMYLFGKEDQPAVAEVLQQYYDLSLHFSKQWIMTGHQHGVIPQTVDADKIGELFMLLSLGLRVRSTISAAPAAFKSQDFTSFIIHILQPR
ncbi:TetR/AcrR family transcriptional regulator [Paenibacillus solisilvae]|uniref:TetR/AcrR family transcriptional regulator n=1 Tax=Paenibacillus solisilvae TaxID=2486751 RepID=A0ABW0VRJ5_9BACL